MKHNLLILLAACAAATAASCSCNKSSYESRFTAEGLRIDYYATGNRTSEKAEVISLCRVPVWSGPQKGLIGPDLGDYRTVMTDARSGDTLFVSGYSTLFGEWRTTAEALDTSRSYYSSKTLPMPRRKAKVSFECRDRRSMKFFPIGETEVCPSRVKPCSLPSNEVEEISINGDFSVKADLTFIAEGYRLCEKEKFFSDARRFTDALFACPPFDSHREDFNVRAVMVPSEDSGTDMPGVGIWKNTALNSNFYTFGTERYLTTADMKPVADAIWETPTDAIFILVNEEKYGGGGIYNFYAIGTSDNHRTLDVFIHEFGHSFGALADEYFDSETAYEEDAFYCLDAEPWEPNITTMVDFDSKWKNWHDGVFEGGGYLPKGIWRPADHCMMRDYAPFCPVCTKAIERNIDYLCGR